MRQRDAGPRAIRRTALVACAIATLSQAAAFAVEPPPDRKTARQIEVMEKILDQVLLDSGNFLIRSTPVARGSYLPRFGVLFTFDASLVRHDWGEIDGKRWDKGFRIEEHDGKKVIILGEDLDDEDRDEDEDIRGWSDRRRAKTERVYARGKTEIVDVLLDYGDTLTTLEPDRWVAIQAFLTDEDFIDRREVSRLILKARVSDLRAYAAGDLSEEEMIKRIVEEEY